jgi:large subunit ribosomal protein L31e
MAKLERVYNVPLRKGFIKAVSFKKANRAVKEMRTFLARHMKAEFKYVKLGKELNEFIWKHGAKNPPHHVKVTAIKNDEGHVTAELFGQKYDDTTVVIPVDAEPEKPTKKDVKADEPVVDKKTEKKEKKDDKPKDVKTEKPKTETKPKKVETKDDKPIATTKPTEKKVTEKKESVPKTATKTSEKK